MTREELKAHCERQIAKCEAIYAEDDKMLNSNRLYQEHKLILELLEQESVLDKIRAEIEQLHHHPILDFINTDKVVDMALEIIDKYKEESEVSK